MAKNTRWKAKANIWKRAYDEEHERLIDTERWLEGMESRAKGLEASLKANQRHIELTTQSVEQKKRQYEKWAGEFENACLRLQQSTVLRKPVPIHQTKTSLFTRLTFWLKSITRR